MEYFDSAELCHCLAARRIARYLTRIHDRHLSATNLTGSQFSLLAVLAEHPDVSLSRLAEIMVMERTTLMRALKPLQAAGFIVSRADGPRMPLHLSISADGGKKIKEAFPFWLAAQAEYETQVGTGMAISVRASLLGIVRRNG